MKYIAAVLMVLTLTACEQRQKNIGPSTIALSGGGYGIYVRDLKVNGTRCIVVYGSSKGGITCDWEGVYDTQR